MDSIYQWTTIHASIFTNFVSKLNSNNIRFFILRNYEGLPDNNFSKDIDIIISPGSYKRCVNLLLLSLKEADFDHYYIMDYERAHCVYGIDRKNLTSIHIDLIEGYANKGYEILNFDELYNNTVLYKFFRVLSPSYDAVMLLLYKVVGVKELKQRYRDKIGQIYKSNRIEILEILERVLDSSCYFKITNDLDNLNYENIVSNAHLISQSAKKVALKRNVCKTLIGWYKFYCEKAYNIIWCPKKMQKMIAVEAPDGTGKTTFIDNLVVAIAKTFVSDISKSKIYHHRPNILPNIGAVGEKAGIMRQNKNFTEPHRAKPAGFISSLIRMIYYWIDYVIGVPLILRKNAQFDKITIFDRYIYDFLVDPYRTRIKMPYWIRKIFSQLVKQPRIVFVLDANADTIYARKQELSKEEIDRQLHEFRKLSNLGKRVHFLDATQTPEKIAQDAIKIVIDELAEKL